MCKAVRDMIDEEVEQCKLETLVSLVKDGLLDIAEGAKRAGISIEEFQAKIKD